MYQKAFLIFLILQLPTGTWAGTCQSLFSPHYSTEIRQTIIEFEAQNEEVLLTPKSQIPVVINGLKDPSQKWPTPFNTNPVRVAKRYNVIVIGAGMAGSTAAMTAVNEGLSTLVLEKENRIGGLASGKSRGGNEYGNGTAYYSPLIPEQEPIYQILGLNNWEKDAAIASPIDSLYIPDGLVMKDGTIKKVFKNFWEDDKVLEELPAGFALTKWAHFKLEEWGQIPNQPIEEANSPFDKMTYEQFLHSQYDMLKNYLKEHPQDSQAQHLWDRIQSEIKSGRINPEINEHHKGIVDPVIRFYVINYSHSAKGGRPDLINAASALNFFYSEMVTRYTYPLGTGEISRRTEAYLRKNSNLATLLTHSFVEKIEVTDSGVYVSYIKDGVRFEVLGDYLIFSAPLSLAPQLISNFSKLAPQHDRIIKEYIRQNQETDYVVTAAFIDGHPSAVKLTYDFWIGQNNFTLEKPTDFISGEWMKYEGYQKPIPENDKVSVLTIYHPLGPTRPHTKEELLQLAENDIAYMKSIYDPMLKESGEKPLKVRFAEVNLWPQSLLVPRVNHFENAKVLVQPIADRIRFAVSGWLGTPSHEEAQYRGWRAAKEIAEQLRNQSSAKAAR